MNLKQEIEYLMKCNQILFMQMNETEHPEYLKDLKHEFDENQKQIQLKITRYKGEN